MSRLRGALQRFVRWLFGSPVEDLPPEFGDPRPPELRVFEKELEAREELQQRHGAQGDADEEHRPPHTD